MRIRTGMGTTPTILVIVVTIGDGRPRGDRPCAAPRTRPARVARAGVAGIPAATGATAPRENPAGVARLVATRLWACAEPRAACDDAPTTCVVVVTVRVLVGVLGAVAVGAVAVGVGVGVVAVSVGLMDVFAVGVFAVGVFGVDGVGVRVSGAGIAAALPAAADGGTRQEEWDSPVLSWPTCEVAGLPALSWP